MNDQVDVSRSVDALFGPIGDRAIAEHLARLLAGVAFGLAFVAVAFALAYGRPALLLGVALALLGVAMLRRLDRATAWAFLAVTVAALGLAVLEVFDEEGATSAWALVASLVGVCAGGRAVVCAHGLRRFASGRVWQPGS